MLHVRFLCVLNKEIAITIAITCVFQAAKTVQKNRLQIGVKSN